MSEKNPSTPAYTASEISNLIGDVVKVGKSGTTFHRPDGRLLSREEIRQIINNADLIRGYDFSENDEKTVSDEGNDQLLQPDEAQPEHVDTWPTDYDSRMNARFEHLEREISKLKSAINAISNHEHDADMGVTPRRVGSMVPYTGTWPEVAREEPGDPEIIPLQFDSGKNELPHKILSKIRQGLGAVAAKVTSTVGLEESKATGSTEAGAGKTDSVAAETSREKPRGLHGLKRKLGLTAVAAVAALLPASSSYDRISGTDGIAVATPPTESVTPEVPDSESTPDLFSIIEETSVVEPAPSPDIDVTFWDPELPAESVQPSSIEILGTQVPATEEAGDPGENKAATEQEEMRSNDSGQTTSEGENGDDIVDLTGDPIDTSEVTTGDTSDIPENTFERSGTILTIESDDGFTSLLRKYRPELSDAESYTLFRRLLEVFGAENIFNDVETFEMENGDPGIKRTGTTRFAPGVQEFVDTWAPGQ